MFGLLGIVLANYLLADLIAGFWHWLEDRYFEETWPIIGEYIAKPNTLHHEQPTAFLFHSYWRRNYTTIIPAAAAGVIAFLLVGLTPWLLTFVFVSQANEIHALAHRKGKVPQWVAILQEIGLLQSPRHHGEHHRSPFEIKYCVMSDWLNPLLDYFQVWRALEAIVKTLTGIEPKPA